MERLLLCLSTLISGFHFPIQYRTFVLMEAHRLPRHRVLGHGKEEWPMTTCTLLFPPLKKISQNPTYSSHLLPTVSQKPNFCLWFQHYHHSNFSKIQLSGFVAWLKSWMPFQYTTLRANFPSSQNVSPESSNEKQSEESRLWSVLKGNWYSSCKNVKVKVRKNKKVVNNFRLMETKVSHQPNTMHYPWLDLGLFL